MAMKETKKITFSLVDSFASKYSTATPASKAIKKAISLLLFIKIKVIKSGIPNIFLKKSAPKHHFGTTLVIV